MKFMKLGSRPDTFYTTEAVRAVSSEISSDLIVQVKGSRYLLHKFPLLSKCLLLQKLCSESHEASKIQLIKLPDFPGGVEAFELCAKFCYGITITLSAFNIVSIRCAAEYLQMTEEVDKGNLVHKVEAFFSSCILHGWRDILVTLQTTKAFPLVSEELGLTGRCIDAAAYKVLAKPEKVSLLHSHSRRGRDELSSNPSDRAKGWWGEDLAELGLDLYWRVMVAIKAGGKVSSSVIGDALKAYASRWLPNLPKSIKIKSGGDEASGGNEVDSKNRLILESIVSLLPAEKDAVSCSFLLKLLKAANILRASLSSKTDLARRISLQLQEATVSDLLLPNCSSSNTMYDVDTFTTILEEFMLQGESPKRDERRAERRRSRSAEDIDLEFQERRRSSSASHSSKLKVAKLVDGYLQEIAKDENLPLSKFISIAEVIPQFARPNHDDLYKAISIYLKGHPELNKGERKRLCRILDCKKLSVEACMDAAQNEMLPLRVVVQVLFFEHARAAKAGGEVSALTNNIKVLLEGCATPSEAKASFSTTGLKTPQSRVSTLRMKLDEDQEESDNWVAKPSKTKPMSMISARPKRLFSKLWPISRVASEKN